MFKKRDTKWAYRWGALEIVNFCQLNTRPFFLFRSLQLWTFLYISIIYSVILLKLPNCHFSHLPAICIDYRIHQAFHYWTFTEIHQPFASRFTNLSIPSSQVWSKVQWRSLLGEAAATCVSKTSSTKTTRYWCCMWGPMCILYVYIVIIYFYCCIIIIYI